MALAVAHSCAQYMAPMALQDTWISALSARPQPISHSKLWSFLRKIKLSRDSSNLKNFADGVLVAEVIHAYGPLLVPLAELHRLHWQSKSEDDPRSIWHQLTLTAFKQLCIKITEPILVAFENGNKEQISDFLMVLFQQLDHYIRVYQAFTPSTRQVISEHYHFLTTIRTFDGKVCEFSRIQPRIQNKSVIRLSNVDHQSTKLDVKRFLYPIIVEDEDIYIPINLASGKMIYTIFVVLDDPILPLSAVGLHSGHALLSRRVEIKTVPFDELLMAYFGHGLHEGSARVEEWVSEDLRAHLSRLFTNRSTFNAKTPERPFEHISSILQLISWIKADHQLSQPEITRLYEIVQDSLRALAECLNSNVLENQHHFELQSTLITAALSLPLENEQLSSLRNQQNSSNKSDGVVISIPDGRTCNLVEEKPLYSDVVNRRKKRDAALRIKVPHASKVISTSEIPTSAPATVSSHLSSQQWRIQGDVANMPKSATLPKNSSKTLWTNETEELNFTDVCAENVLGMDLWSVL